MSRSPDILIAADDPVIRRAVKAALKKMGWEGDVTPVLCMASDTCSAPETEVRRVALLNSSAVVKWLVGKPAVIPPNELARLSQLMETCL